MKRIIITLPDDVDTSLCCDVENILESVCCSIDAYNQANHSGMPINRHMPFTVVCNKMVANEEGRRVSRVSTKTMDFVLEDDTVSKEPKPAKVRSKPRRCDVCDVRLEANWSGFVAGKKVKFSLCPKCNKRFPATPNLRWCKSTPSDIAKGG